MNYKKGAMFGLDARIALAIFGALSVISGAALYSAIQQSKVVALITEMKEVEKAFEAFYLDTGKMLPTQPGYESFDFQTIHLKENSTNIEGWNGPYINLPTSTVDTDYLLNKYNDIYYIYRTDIGHTTVGEGGTSLGEATQACSATAGKICQTYIQARSIPLNIIKGVDEYIDGTVDGNDGNVRWFSSGRLLIKSIIINE